MSPTDQPLHLFCFGLGYSASQLGRRLLAEGWMLSGTRRASDSNHSLSGARVYEFGPDRPLDDAKAALSGVTHVLSSVPPDADGDPVLNAHGEALERLGGVAWVGYLSSTGVYGDTGGRRVDESSPVNPNSERTRWRADAERAWLELGRRSGLPVHVFRLAGIYGPGRSALDQVRSGRARRIDKPGHRFSRIHVADIANVLLASIRRPDAGAVYNVCDDEPAAAADVTAYACELLELEPPALVPFEEATKDMSPMALSFWADDRIVDNRRIREELGVELDYPTYREGLRAIHAGSAD